MILSGDLDNCFFQEEEEKKEQELRDQQLLNDALLALQLQDELMVNVLRVE